MYVRHFRVQWSLNDALITISGEGAVSFRPAMPRIKIAR
jgi:hypothetical protein